MSESMPLFELGKAYIEELECGTADRARDIVRDAVALSSKLDSDLTTLRARAERAERERDEAMSLLAESRESLSRIGPIAEETLRIAKAMKGTRDEAAESERAKIVAMLRRCEEQAMADGRAEPTVPDADPEQWRNGFAGAATAFAEAAKKVTRLDHHTDAAAKEAGR